MVAHRHKLRSHTRFDPSAWLAGLHPPCCPCLPFTQSPVLKSGGLREVLACMCHHPTAEARDTTAMTSLRMLAVLDVLSSTPARAKRLAPRSDGPLTHFTSPRGETCRLVIESWWVRRTGSRRVVFGGEESPVSIGNRAG